MKVGVDLEKGGGSMTPLANCECVWPFSGRQDFCVIIPNGPAGSIVSFSTCQGLKCYHVPSIPTLSM